MKRTIAYIDGYNLYYGLLQKNPGSKWLDPFAFVKALLRSDHEILRVKFFTARARPYPPDEAAIARQTRKDCLQMKNAPNSKTNLDRAILRYVEVSSPPGISPPL